MPAKPSGEIKTKIVRQPQKNGDIYILERQTIYDTDKKYNKVLSSKLVAKIQKVKKIRFQQGQKGTKPPNQIQKLKLYQLNACMPE